MFWIIAAGVVLLLGLLWWWSGRHSKVRTNLRGYRLDQALGNDAAGDTVIRHHSRGGPSGRG